MTHYKRAPVATSCYHFGGWKMLAFFINHFSLQVSISQVLNFFGTRTLAQMRS
jgi:hypothetical protein